jgi:hypothetical protein
MKWTLGNHRPVMLGELDLLRELREIHAENRLLRLQSPKR